MPAHSPFNVSQLSHLPLNIKSDDLEVGSKALLQGSKAILQVIDAPFDGTTPRALARFCFGDNVAEGLESLSPHSSNTARILEFTVHSDFLITGLRDTKGPESTRPARDALIKYLQDTYTRPFEERQVFRWLNDPLLVNDIGSISSQWSQHLGGKNKNLYRLVNRTSLQQHPLDLDLRPRDSYLTCVQDADDRLIVIVVNDVWSDQFFAPNGSSGDRLLFQNPRMTASILDGSSWTAFGDGSLHTFARLLVLDFFLSSIYLQRVDFFGRLIYPQLSSKERLKFSLTSNPHLQVPLGLFEPRISAKRKQAFQEIEDAEGILRSVNNLVDSIDYVVEALKPDNIVGTQEPARTIRKRYMQELDGLCKERRKNAERALEALNRQLDYLTKRYSIREADSIKRLTILASIYLPLSLAASLLGMQTPFRAIAHNQTQEKQDLDGTNLLFDFLGVFIILASATIFILQIIRLGLWLKYYGLGYISKKFSGPFSIFYYGRKWKFGERGGKIFDVVRVFAAWWLGAGLLICLLVIFIFGMLKNSQAAWNSAWRLFTAYCVVGGVFGIVYIVLYWYLYQKRFRVS
ncbi:hypothetical protein MMC26_003400 [Xylographa opegraphella]|nr:hypothetical protein [Xylographa opegraphella]